MKRLLAQHDPCGSRFRSSARQALDHDPVRSTTARRGSKCAQIAARCKRRTDVRRR